MRWVWVVVTCLAACKPRNEPKPLVRDDARKVEVASADATLTAPVDASVVAPIDGPLDIQGDIYRPLDFAFDKRPALAYVGPGDQVAVFYYDTLSIYQPTACGYRIYKPNTLAVVEKLELVDTDMERQFKDPPPAAVVAQLKQRGAAITAKLAGWTPLELVRQWESQPVKAKIANNTFVAVSEGRALHVTLQDAVSAQLASDYVRSFETKQEIQEDEATVPCSYNPYQVSLYADAKRLLVGVSYYHSIDCKEQMPTWRLWSMTERTPP